MIPYFNPPVIHLGPLAIHGYGIAVAAAAVLGYLIVLSQAKARSLDRNRLGWMYAGSMLAGLIIGHIAGLVAASGAVESGSATLRVWGTQSSWGAAAGGTLAAALFLLVRERRAALPYLDVLALAFPFTYALVRAGCFLAHDHVGARTSHWLAVQFPGGSRFDLGLLECLAALAVGVLAFAMSRFRLAPGVPAGVLAAV
jgi:phosphatidylglycerol:prolipoprotein diacylglycerol transferase